MTTDFDPNQTIKIRVRKAYRCDKEESLLSSKNVYEDPKDGKIRCNSCHTEVRDITNTITGHDFLEILAI